VAVVVMPGEQRVEGFVGEKAIDSLVVEVNNRETQKVELVEQGPESPPPPRLIKQLIQPLPEPEEPELSVGFWIAISSTIVSGVMVSVFGGLALHTKQEQDSAADDEKKKYENTGKQYKIVTNIMIGVTGVSALTALIIGINDLKAKKRIVSLTNAGAGADLGIGLAISF
jgi:hypothetical protein